MAEPKITKYPAYTNNVKTFAIPNDAALKRVYGVYRPSVQTLKLLSEQGRTIYPEVFIENRCLGPLKDLCSVVLARSFGPHPLPIVAENPLLLQVHYDSLDVELPLAKCYDITEDRFWKRVVLAKHPDKNLELRENVNWKNLGVSLKYVELVEQCSAEYWPEEEMKELALKVKVFVTEMHIRHLKSLKKSSFAKYFEIESDETESDGESGIGSLSSNSIQEEVKSEANTRKVPLKKIPDNVFDIEVSDSEDDGESRIIDKRNKALLLRHLKKYDYPAKDCHHIDLKFVQYFTNLNSFTIEFLGPLQNRNFHQRHLNFSYDDIRNLSIGLSHLPQLKVFRLRNSRMDAIKLQTICCALGLLPCLETLDFGFNQLGDDCGLVLKEFLKTTVSLRNLELESNFFSTKTLDHIGKALKNYTAKELLYLGLARNPINDNALHALISRVINTKHVKHLNIRGVQFLTEAGLCCCIANELLRKHPTLTKLDISVIKVSPLAANEIIKSLSENKTILEFYCSGCDLDEEMEIDINVILKRNQYISENFYLGDPSVTNEEITKWLNRSRNPILLKVLAERERHKKCLYDRSEGSTLPSCISSAEINHHSSLDEISNIPERHLQGYPSLEMPDATDTTQRFVYPANDFDEQQFLEHVYQPGPQERYYYFKMCKQKYLIKTVLKISQ